MYRLLYYVLITILATAFILSLAGIMDYSAWAIAYSTGLILAVCLVTNYIFGRVFEAPRNIESAYITAFILALIISPVRSLHDSLFLVAAAGLAMASKYLIAIRKKHIFNPAAIAVVLTAFGASQAASWWVGNAKLLLVVVIGGLLVVHKIRRFKMVLTFLAAALTSTAIMSLATSSSLSVNLHHAIMQSSLFFLAFIMLTEPLTSPPTGKKQMWYGALVGALFPPQIHIFNLYSTPELALVTGNVFSYFISPKLRLTPRLAQKVPTSKDTADFVFATDRPVSYRPGQYMEWTLPHSEHDLRGNRRYFTLASSPTEPTLRLGVKFYNPGSTYKKAMLGMDEQTPIAAGQLGGDFVLPKNPKQKLAFIAGGIGITPYRSMIKYLLDKNEHRDIALLYSDHTAESLVYTDVFEPAREQLGIKTTYFLTDPGAHTKNQWMRVGIITAEAIKSTLPDYKERLFYISGPHPMVEAMRKLLRDLGVPPKQIKTDFFPGYT